jgi:hypothetical protein
MKQPITLIILALLTLAQASADPPPRTVAREQQAIRDHEKLNILQTELNDQHQLAAQLQRQRALNLQSGNTEELAKTEARLEEVTGNLTQLQQEINLAQSQPEANKPVSVRLTVLPKTEEKTDTPKESAKPNNQSGPWWDLYNKRKN